MAREKGEFGLTEKDSQSEGERKDIMVIGVIERDPLIWYENEQGENGIPPALTPRAVFVLQIHESSPPLPEVQALRLQSDAFVQCMVLCTGLEEGELKKDNTVTVEGEPSLWQVKIPGVGNIDFMRKFGGRIMPLLTVKGPGKIRPAASRSLYSPTQ